MFNRYLTFAALATIAAICSAFGQSGVVSGTVRGADGRPAQGAQIRFEGKERSNFTTTTDAARTIQDKCIDKRDPQIKRDNQDRD